MPITGRSAVVGPKYALIPVNGVGIAAATVVRMLDPGGSGTTARVLQPGEPVLLGAQPVLLAETTVYGAVCVEHMLREWNPQLPRPWLVTIADAPAAPPPAARYRFRALQARLAGVAHVPYLPSLRAVEGADVAMDHKDVKKAAVKLRSRLEGK